MTSMTSYFAIALADMGIGRIEVVVISFVLLVFPILFVIASKNLDAKGVF